jgi:hypothetical protein
MNWCPGHPWCTKYLNIQFICHFCCKYCKCLLIKLSLWLWIPCLHHIYIYIYMTHFVLPYITLFFFFFVTKNMAKAVIKFVMEISCILFPIWAFESVPEKSILLSLLLCMMKDTGNYWLMNLGDLRQHLPGVWCSSLSWMSISKDLFSCCTGLNIISCGTVIGILSSSVKSLLVTGHKENDRSVLLEIW